MVDTRDLKSRAEERGGSSPLQGIMLRVLIAFYSFLYFYRSFLCRMELLELQYCLNLLNITNNGSDPFLAMDIELVYKLVEIS